MKRFIILTFLILSILMILTSCDEVMNFDSLDKTKKIVISVYDNGGNTFGSIDLKDEEEVEEFVTSIEGITFKKIYKTVKPSKNSYVIKFYKKLNRKIDSFEVFWGQNVIYYNGWCYEPQGCDINKIIGELLEKNNNLNQMTIDTVNALSEKNKDLVKLDDLLKFNTTFFRLSGDYNILELIFNVEDRYYLVVGYDPDTRKSSYAYLVPSDGKDLKIDIWYRLH